MQTVAKQQRVGRRDTIKKDAEHESHEDEMHASDLEIHNVDSGHLV